jgi:putative glutamine amidotransferase
MRPIIGIPACAREIRGQVHHTAPARYGEALIACAGALPILIPPIGEAALALLDRLDGLMLDGSPSNVAPALYGASEDLTPEDHDPARDATTLPLARAALARGMPLLAICRGIQELNVALGGTLIQRLADDPKRIRHMIEDGPRELRYAPLHPVRLSGELAKIFGTEEMKVNSVHTQAIDRLAPGLAVEAVAPDGTIEGVRVIGAKSFAFGVQWHPEWRAAENEASRRLFAAFGEACRAWRAAHHPD